MNCVCGKWVNCKYETIKPELIMIPTLNRIFIGSHLGTSNTKFNFLNDSNLKFNRTSVTIEDLPDWLF